MKQFVLPLLRPGLTFAVVLQMVCGGHWSVFAQGVTTSALNGIVTSEDGESIIGANVVAVHEPTGTKYGAITRTNGQYNIPNMRVGGPYSITASMVGYKKEEQRDVILGLAQDSRIDFTLKEQVQLGEEVLILGKLDEVLNGTRTGAATNISPVEVAGMPTIKRSIRDLIRLDPRSDGNYSFGGRNWLFNNISLDGSYFNNPFGLDDPAPGGQTNAEPVPFDAVEQVQVSVAPFDVREGGFTGAGINTVTKSGTNANTASVYSFFRNQSLVGNTVRGTKVVANPDLTYSQSGFTASGPIIPNVLFFFLNAELDRRKDPGTNFAANRGQEGFGISRVRASTMDSIRSRMINVYGYDPGPYEGYTNRTDNEKLLLKLDWNAGDHHSVSLRYNFLNARRDLPPHPFVLSYAGTGRGPNENSLPFQNSGYRMNNHLNSFALEVHSRYEKWANRFFSSYNRFRDFRDPLSRPFPTIEIADNGVTYTTLGHEPFSIHNILDQDVWQFTNTLSYYTGNHALTAGVTYEAFRFFNAFNIFRYGVFQLPPPLTRGGFGGSSFGSIADFFRYTDPADSLFLDFNTQVAAAELNPFKGEEISVGQLAFYAQDSYLVTDRFNFTLGIRVDFPIYFTTPVDNPFSRSLTLLDEDGKSESVDQSRLPGMKPLFSPRIGFNWDVNGDRSTQLRGGTGIFTGRLPFVWIGNVISNPGANPNLWEPGNPAGRRISTGENTILRQSFDVNGMVADFKWPQLWTTNVAVDQRLPGEWLGTLEIIYGKDINAIFVRNADLRQPVRYLPDGRPYYGGAGANELNPDGGAGVYVLDNTDKGYNFSISAQLRRQFDFGLSASVSYTYLVAKNAMKSTEIASALFAENPTRGNPNVPDLGYSEFGERNRLTAAATYSHHWSENLATRVGIFIEIAEGNRYAGAGGNRYSYVYSGDVNGDGMSGNDLIYVPRSQGEIVFAPYTDQGHTHTAEEQWASFNAFVEQDEYLREHRGEIAERFGGLNPWFANIDLRVLQDITFSPGEHPHTFQLSVDILNVLNLLNSRWGIRRVATSAATNPLELADFNGPSQAPRFYYRGTATQTFVDDPGVYSRWQVQVGLRYMFN